MEIGTNPTAYDFLVMGLLLLLIGRGLWLGFLKQVIGLIALYFGYIVASQYHDRLFPFLRDFSENPKVIFFCSYALLFAATYHTCRTAWQSPAFCHQNHHGRLV